VLMQAAQGLHLAPAMPPAGVHATRACGAYLGFVVEQRAIHVRAVDGGVQGHVLPEPGWWWPWCGLGCAVAVRARAVEAGFLWRAAGAAEGSVHHVRPPCLIPRAPKAE